MFRHRLFVKAVLRAFANVGQAVKSKQRKKLAQNLLDPAPLR